MKTLSMESESQYRTLIQNLPEAIYTCDDRGFIKMYNKAAVNLWGREPVIGQDLWWGSWKIYNKDGSYLAPGNCPMAIALKEGRTVYGEEIMVERPDGSIRHVKTFPSPLFNAHGQFSGTINMLIDVTEKIEKEKLIEDKYRNLVEQAADGIFLFDMEGNFLSANNNGCLMLGYDKTTLLTLNINDIIPPQYQGKEFIKSAALYKGNPVLAEREYMRKDGTVFYTEVNAQITSKGNIQAIVRDITDRRKAKENMQKAIDRYDLLAKATSDTLWDWDIVNNQMLYNEGITKMFGYEKESIDNLVEWWKEKIHPDDFHLIAETIKEVFEKKLEMVQLEYRFHCANDSYKYIYDRAYVIYDGQENPVRMIGAMQNVTYLKEEENRIAKAIIDAQEQERRHIGQELHDNVNQILAGSMLTLGMAKLEIKDTAKASGFIDLTHGHIGSAIDEIRKLSHQLAPVSFDENTLKDIFENLLLKINLNNRFKINLQIGEIKNGNLTDDIQINLYRILQEQIKNIQKYSGASCIDISLTETGDMVRMRIFDDGRGFDPKNTSKGIGINNIKKRAQFFSGKFMLNSAPGKGCELIIEIPLNED